MSDTSLITFKAITTFTNALGELFGSDQRSLKLYCRLINQTTLANDNPIRKHIEAFKKFCVANRPAITSKDSSKLTVNTVEYSKRVFIDFKPIFMKADEETTAIIWKHLLVVSALVDPAGKAKNILQNVAASSDLASGSETNFLTDIIDKVEKNVDPEASPMQAISSIMSSGIFTDLIGGMNNGLQDGSLDLGKLMGAVQGMVTTAATETRGGVDDEAPTPASAKEAAQQMPDIIGMLGPMMSAFGGGGGGSADGNPLAGLMENLVSQPKSVEETIDEQLSNDLRKEL